MTEAITMIQTRRSATGSGLLHPHHSVLKQIKPFSSDSQVLEASTCCYTPFCSVPFCILNGGHAYTGTIDTKKNLKKMKNHVGMESQKSNQTR